MNNIKEEIQNHGFYMAQRTVTIDVVNDSGMEDKNFKTYNYTVDKVGTYQYYKLDVQAIYGSGCQISEISMRGATVSPNKYDFSHMKSLTLFSSTVEN